MLCLLPDCDVFVKSQLRREFGLQRSPQRLAFLVEQHERRQGQRLLYFRGC